MLILPAGLVASQEGLVRGVLPTAAVVLVLHRRGVLRRAPLQGQHLGLAFLQLLPALLPDWRDVDDRHLQPHALAQLLALAYMALWHLAKSHAVVRKREDAHFPYRHLH